jgi:hypothetical protein
MAPKLEPIPQEKGKSLIVETPQFNLHFVRTGVNNLLLKITNKCDHYTRQDDYNLYKHLFSILITKRDYLKITDNIKTYAYIKSNKANDYIVNILREIECDFSLSYPDREFLVYDPAVNYDPGVTFGLKTVFR